MAPAKNRGFFAFSPCMCISLFGIKALIRRDLNTKILPMSTATELPNYVALTGYACLLIALFFIYFAYRKSTMGLVLWLAVLAVSLGLSFAIPASMSAAQKWLFLLLPGLAALGLQLSNKWTALQGEMGDDYLHFFHLWRLPAAFIPLWMYQSGVAPLQITFEGLNFDIIAGLTAPVLSSLAFSQQMLNRTVVLVWNILAALLLLSSCWLLIDEMSNNEPFSNWMNHMPFASLLFVLPSLSLAFHLLEIARLVQGKLKLAE